MSNAYPAIMRPPAIVLAARRVADVVGEKIWSKFAKENTQ
jgi:hypothetical protein